MQSSGQPHESGIATNGRTNSQSNRQEATKPPAAPVYSSETKTPASDDGRESGSYWPPSSEWTLVFVTVLLVIYTGKLWRSTNKLVVDAGVNAERQLRAYALLEKLDPLDEVTPTWPHLREYAATVKNFGQTPAYDLIWQFNVDILDADEKETITVPLKLSEKVTKMTLGPGHSVGAKIHATNFNEGGRSALRAKTHAVYFRGVISYTDAFGKPRKSTFRYMRNIETGIFEGCQEGNDSD